MTKEPRKSEQNALAALTSTLAELIDKVSVRAEAGFSVQRQLQDLMSDWKDRGGGLEGEGLIQRAQGKVGMINASADGHPTRDLAYRDLTEYKNELRALARSA